MLTEALCRPIRKEDLLQFLHLPPRTHATRKEIVRRLVVLLEADTAMREQFLERFKLELAVSPTELERLLGCTTTERKRWTLDGKIPILEFRIFHKWGRDHGYPVFDRRLVMAIAPDNVDRWRRERKRFSMMRQSSGAAKAAVTRKAYEAARASFVDEWEATLARWQQQGSAELAAVFALAYWTTWASRWAKEHQQKSLSGAYKHRRAHIARKEQWYERKDVALRMLARTPFARVSFYRPERDAADRLQVQLCEEHREDMRDLRHLSDTDFWEYVRMNKRQIERCPACTLTVERDYYALYYLEIRTKQLPGTRFSFHIPYPIGATFLPPADNLPKVAHVEQDGMFRFGRALIDEEKIIHRERAVLAGFESALAAARALYPELT